MQVNKIFLGMLACAMMCACSSVESDVDDAPKVFTGDEAYITVRLTDANAQTRASAGEYEEGSEAEHAVTNAYFYFYDASGNFVAEGSAWNGGFSSNGNVEFKSNTIVALKGVSQKNFPKYMVTVLNRPTGFTPASTLALMEKKLSDDNGVGIYDGNGKFVMSTTSFKPAADATGTNPPTYFTTEVKEENFSLEPVDHTMNIANYVDVFVERLAAKVTLRVSDKLGNDTTINDSVYYTIRTTVAGQGNASTDSIAADTLYVKFLGWKLNATAKRSNMVKNIDLGWADQYPGFAWNNANDHRSFWGMSFNYGDTNYTYPSSSNSTSNTDALNYVNLKSDLVKVGLSSYCAENTNTSEIVSANFPSAVTCILLKAQICDKNGEALNLVRFNGILFTEAQFKKYILNTVDPDAYHKKEVNDNTSWTQIDENDVVLEKASGGVVYLKIKEDVGALFKKSSEDLADIDKINVDLKDASGDANGFNGGLMYYNIPIEHLNNAENTTSGDDKTIIPEAKYGVVRNHHYVVTITDFEKLGRGIYDPEEIIVPDNDDKETYYVGANINILSWKLVSQDVEL